MKGNPMKSLIGGLAVFAAGIAVASTVPYETDVVIYGATPAGLSAAVQVSRMGAKAVVLEPTGRIGGMTTGGLGQTDFGNKDAFGGIALEFYRDVRKWYADPSRWKSQTLAEYAPDGQCADTKGADTMWTFEPSAALAILEGWEKSKGLDIRRGERLDRAEGGVVKKDGRISAIRTETGKIFHGKVFIDASYEGDLMAAAGISYVVGRESNRVYGETLNGIQRARSVSHQFPDGVDPYVKPGDPSSGLLPGVEKEDNRPDGSGDSRVQAYCFRMCLTDHAENRIPFAKPAGYDERDYELLFRFFERVPQEEICVPWINSKMPNRKTDTNNALGFSTDFIGGSAKWPEASYAERERIFNAHLCYQRGLMWTLANHPRIPEKVRSTVSRWGTCKDEFSDGPGAGWQGQLYVREARRMLGEYVMTEHECLSRRKVPRPVALGAYGLDSHHCRRYVGKDGFVRNEGDIQYRLLDDGRRMRPYSIDYGALLPKRDECRNLLVPVCLSASHIAFGSIRMETAFFALGQVAGTAAALALAEGRAVQDVDYSALRAKLLADGQVISPSLDPAEGKSCRIVGPSDPKPWEKTAVKEFGDFFMRVCLQGKVTVTGLDGVVFHVGDTEFARSKGLGSDSLEDEEWAVRSFGRDVVLNGGGSRGCLYAVYRFLEDRCWFRWWSNGEIKHPKAMPLEFAEPIDIRGRPGTRYRAIAGLKDVDFRTLVRNRLNGGAAIPEEWGGSASSGGTPADDGGRYDFPELEFRVLSRMMEDPKADIGYVEADFTCQYYGASAYRAVLTDRRRARPEAGWRARRFDIVRGGKPVADIVCAPGTEDAVEFFTEETRKCGVSFTPVKLARAGRSRIVFVLDEKRPPAEEDAYSISFPDPGTLRITCTKTSARWAVNRILREAFGIRWPYLPTMRKHVKKMKEFVGGEFNEYPRNPDVSMERVRLVQGPYSFWAQRTMDWKANLNRLIFDCKNHLPSHKQCADAFPAWKYAADRSWPREMLPVLKGGLFIPPKPKNPLKGDTERQRLESCKGYNNCWNPCYSHPATAMIAASNILARIAADHGRTGIYNLDINDIGGMCRCERCLRAVGKKRTSVGHPDYSDIYYRYVNKVAETVCAKYPSARFALLAYCSVLPPPSFRLHPNVYVRCCFEISSMMDNEVRENRLSLIRGWTRSTRNVGIWDYNYGLSAYLLPRIAYRGHSRFLKELYEAGVCGLYSESCESPLDGPKHYIMMSLLRDIDADPEALFSEWCRMTVGENAAPALERFFRFWDGYWSSDRIRLTTWYKSVRSTYMPLGIASPAYALEKGDMVKCRALLDEVSEKAVTTGQKRRARILSEFFRLSEDACTAIFAEMLSPDGCVATPEVAAGMLDGLPEACAALERIKRNAFADRFVSADSIASFQRTSLSGIAVYAEDPCVREKLVRLSGDPSVPAVMRGMFRIWSGGGGENLVPDGSFEAGSPLPKGWRGGPLIGRRTEGQASDGRFSIGGNELMIGYEVAIKPGKTYLFMFDAFAADVNPEGTFNFQLSPVMDNIPRVHIKGLGLKPPVGKWQTYCGTVSSEYRAKYKKWDDVLWIHVYARKWNDDDTVNVDNFRLYELAE